MELADLKHKKIAVLGFGVEGRAVAKYLRESGISFDVLDKSAKLQKPPELADCDFILGAGYLSRLKNYDIIFRSPGISVNLPEIADAKKSGVIVSSQIKYFFENCPAKIIGVTGTKGKGTTSTLIYNILNAQGFNCHLGGNVGADVISLVGNLSPSDWVVLELSSFQLQDLEQSPHIAVVLMVEAEHLDVHKDEREYVEAKSSITKFQSENDFAVINVDFRNSAVIGAGGKAQKFYIQTLNAEDAGKPLKIKNGIFADQGKAEIYAVRDGHLSEYFALRYLTIRGFHMVQNVCAAIMAAELAGARDEIIKQEISNFKGLEHRMELVAEIGGAKYYNDSIGTTPQACIAAVKAFEEPTIAICGGFDKKADYEQLGADLGKLKNLKAAVLIGAIAPRLANSLEQSGFRGKILSGASSMKEAVEQARGMAEPGDTVILAPGTSSFDMFKDYKDRGEQFKASVRNLFAKTGA